MMDLIALDPATITHLEQTGGTAQLHRAASRLATHGPAALAALEAAHLRGNSVATCRAARWLGTLARRSGARWLLELAEELERSAAALDEVAVARLLPAAAPLLESACYALRHRASLNPPAPRAFAANGSRAASGAA